MYAYANALLDEKTIKLSLSPVSHPEYNSMPLLLPKFFTKRKYSIFENSLTKALYKFVLTISSSLHKQNFMVHSIEQSNRIFTTNNHKIAPENSFHIFLIVTYLGHENGNNTNNPTSSEVAGEQKLKTPTSKKELLRFVGSMNFYSTVIKKLLTSLEPFYTLLHDFIS